MEEEGGAGTKKCLPQPVRDCRRCETMLKSVDWESRGSFMNGYVRLEKPVIVRNFVKKWVAAKKWTPEFFLELYVTPTRPEGRLTSPTVTVSVGNEESSTSGSHKEKISLREYMEGIIEEEAQVHRVWRITFALPQAIGRLSGIARLEEGH